MTNKLLVVTVVVLFAIALFLGSFLYFSARPHFKTNTLSPPTKMHVPEPNEISNEKGLTVPATARPVSPGLHNKIRTFVLTADKNSFLENKLIVYEGDVVQIRFTATDHIYDISFPELGLKQEVNAGETKLLEFQAMVAGNFPFLCESCKNENTKGTLVVVPKI